jgi:hypothetical protein
MDATVSVRPGMALQAVWAVASMAATQVLAGVVFAIFIGVAEFAAIAFTFTERIGVPVFVALLALAVIAYAAAIHVLVRVLQRSAAVPWVVWPAAAALPVSWIVVTLLDRSDALEPMLAALTLAGLALAFVSLGKRRWSV